MTIKEFKRIGRLLKEAYAELEREAMSEGISIFSPEYDELVEKTREKILETTGFTLEEYREAKDKAESIRKETINKNLSLMEETNEKLKTLEEYKLEIPTSEQIKELAEEVAEEVVKRNLKPPQITNQIVKEITKEVIKEEPKIIETVRVEKVEYDDEKLLKRLAELDSKIAEIIIPDKEEIKEELSEELSMDLQKNIDILGMPDFRKLGMGLQAQIDELKADENNAEVNKIIAGTDISISPTSGIGSVTINNIHDHSIYVPYTGATGGVNLGTYGLYTPVVYGSATTNTLALGNGADLTTTDRVQIMGNLNLRTVDEPTDAEMDTVVNSISYSWTGGTLSEDAEYYYTVGYVDEAGNPTGSSSTNYGYIYIDPNLYENTATVSFNIPVSTDPRVSARWIYRGEGTMTCYRIAVVNDNTTTTFTDTGYAQNTAYMNIRSPNQTAGIIKKDDVAYTFLDPYSISYGANALLSLTSGAYNTAIGNSALYALTASNYSTAIGYEAGRHITTATGQTLIGYRSGYNATTGVANTFIGYQSGRARATASSNFANNTAIGYSSMDTVSITSIYNMAIGGYALYRAGNNTNNPVIGYNTAVGMYAGYELGAGSANNQQWNTFVGYYAGAQAGRGGISNSNTFIGYYSGNKAGYSATTQYNIAIGYEAGYNASGGTYLDGAQYDILIGTGAMVPVANTSNFMNLGQVLYATGLGTGGYANAGGKVGVNTYAPDKALEVNSADGNNLRLTYNDGNGSASNYTDFTLSATGDLTINSSGGDISTANDFHSLSDTAQHYFGAGDDMSIDYDGTQGNIKTDLVAASDLHIDCGTDKTIVLDIPVWDDLRVTPAGFDRAGIADPSLVSYTPTGSSIATYLYEFQKDDIAYFTVQLPHSYKQGSDLSVHIHWTPGLRGNEESGNTVGWKVDYTWANIDGTFGAMATADLSDACDGTDDKHQMTPSVTITGTGKNMSSMLICNIKRTDTGADDTWVGTASGELPMLLEVDFHYQIDTIGSRTSSSK